MKLFINWLLALGLALVVGLVQAEEVIVTVKSGDTVSQIAQAHGVKTAAVCTRNASEVPNCNHIRPGQNLVVEKVAIVVKSQRVAAAPVPKTQVLGLIPIKVLNVAPYRLSRTSSLDRTVLQSQGWTDAEVAEFHSLEKSGQCELQAFEAGAPMKWMVGARGKVTTSPDGLVAAWSNFHSARVCELASGKRLAIFQICENLAELPRLPKAMPPAVPPAAAPQPEEPVSKSAPSAPPAPPQREEPAPTPTMPTATTTDPICKDWNPKAVVGQRHEFPLHGETAHSTYAQMAVYCMRKVKGGEYGIGPIAHGSSWNGSVEHGAGHYRGYFASVGLGHYFISDDYWDLLVGFLIGRLSEDYSAGDYQSHRHFGMITALVNANNYRDKLLGKTSLYETQGSLVVGVPFSRSASATWQGRSLVDTTELRRLTLYASFGVREYLWREWLNTDVGNLEVYGEIDGVVEAPGVRKVNVDLGVTLFRRCVGIGAGPEYDFIKHRFGAGWSPWTDLVQCYRVYRTNERAKELVVTGTTHGNSFDEADLVPLPSQGVSEPRKADSKSII